MPRIIDYPGCCTARILVGFGDSNTADYRYRPEGNRLKPGVLTDYLKKQIPFFKNAGNVAMIFATTNSDQKQAMSELKAFGFQPTRKVSKKQHADKDLIGWHYIVAEDAGDVEVAPYKDGKPVKEEPAKLQDVQGDLNVGDRVYIRKGLEFTDDELREIGWYHPMSDYLGRVGTITHVVDDEGFPHFQVEINGNGYYWPRRFLILR